MDRMVLAVLLVVAPCAAHGDDGASALAERFAPVVRLQVQDEPCGHGEPFQPTDVDLVLGNPEVALRGPWDRTNIVKIGPSGADLTGDRFGYHLDFPGDPLAPGCDYEEWSRRLTAGSLPTIYAHVVAQPERSTVSLQYWLFYPYNDFNNKHEGDWEMIQLQFAARDVAEALSAEPLRIGYSQHESAESAAWDAAKLERVGGTHAVVYPAAGSHANYFEPSLYLGRTAAQGVGCDDATGPSRDVHPRVVLVPATAAEQRAALPWLAYAGRWGEKQSAFYDGPTGPNEKPQWVDPAGWADERWRERSFAVVGGGLLGPDATGFFCDAVAAGSDGLRALILRPGAVGLALLLVAGLLAWLASRTRWRDAVPLHLARRRDVGQMLSSALRLYAAHPRLFVGIGFAFVPLGLLAGVLQVGVLRVVRFERVASSSGEASTLAAGVGLAIVLLFGLVALVLVQAACARAMAGIDAGRRPTALETFRGLLAESPSLVSALLLVAPVLTLLTVSTAGLPVAAWLLVRSALLGQVAALEHLPGIGALRRSAALVRGRWWRCAGLLLLAAVVPALAGPLLGALLLIAGELPFAVVNLVSSLVYAVAMPFTAIATTYLYFDLCVRMQLEPIRPGPAVLPAEISQTTATADGN